MLPNECRAKNESSAKSATDIVMKWQQGAERWDYQSIRGLLSDNISYVSPLNPFNRVLIPTNTNISNNTISSKNYLPTLCL